MCMYLVDIIILSNTCGDKLPAVLLLYSMSNHKLKCIPQYFSSIILLMN